MPQNLTDWIPRPAPQRIVLDGRFCCLEPFDAKRHGAELYQAVTAKDADDRFAWLPETAPASMAEFQQWLDFAQGSADPLYFAVIDKRTGRVEGRQTLMRHDPANGVIEIGHIFWGGKISRTPVTTEAYFLFAQYIFDTLGYRRFEWKCNNRNAPSKRAAHRFGMTFEGLFRQAAVVKGENRDTAWYSLLDHEWSPLRERYKRWLAPQNFDAQGIQIKALNDI